MPDPALHTLRVSRTARYAQYGDPKAPDWWVVLHGYGQRASDFIQPFAEGGVDGRCIVAPEALSRFYTDGMAAHQEVGASWMTRVARAEEIGDYVRYLDALVQHLRPDGTAPRLHVLGFSQGAATASRWAVLGNTPVERLTLWAGDLAHDLELDVRADALRAMDLTIVLGRDDPFISEDRLQTLRDRLDAYAIPATVHRFDGGHRLHRATLRRLSG